MVLPAFVHILKMIITALRIIFRVLKKHVTPQYTGQTHDVFLDNKGFIKQDI